MAIRVIRTDEDPILRKKSRKIDKIDIKIQELLDDMVDTMVNANGIGLAAPQVGILRRAVVIDVGQGPIKIVNPEIIETKGSIKAEEGCLSVPGYSGNVERPEFVKIKYLDENGKDNTISTDGLLARAIFHEIDHLDGVLYTDKATEMFKVGEDVE